MEQFRVTIKSETGLHARPASQLVKQAVNFSSQIKIGKADQTADAKRLLSIMGLNVKQGDSINVVVEGEDEEVAASAIKEILEAY